MHIHTWQFDVETISRMLSPKDLNTPYTPNFDRPFFADILEEVTKNAPSFTDQGTGSAYRFLNDTVKTCREALSACGASEVPPREKRWFRDSQSIFKDVEAEGSSRKNHTVSDVIPLLGISREKNLTDRVANYARGLFRATPTCIWSLVLVFSQETLALHSFIFLRGGCMCIASHGMCLKEVEGRKGVCRIVLTMLLWTEPWHAGFTDVSVSRSRLKEQDPIELWVSGPSCHPVLLPPVEKPPTAFILLGDVGEPLIHADRSWKICETVIHAILGWLNYYEAGYLYREISISNLLRLKQPTTVEPSKVSILTDIDTQPLLVNDEVTMEDAEKVALFNCGDVLRTKRMADVTSSSQEAADVLKLLETARSEVSKQATRIEEALSKLGIKDQCNAVLTDGDVAADWKNYFDKTHGSHTKSGTPEFMSSRLHLATEMRCDHLQSPVDDLHSFFWVTMWAVMFNEHNKKRSQPERWWQEWLTGGARDKFTVPADMQTHRRRSDHSPIFREMVDVLLEWYQIIEKLAKDWQEEVLAREPSNDAARWYPTQFHLYAYRGAAELLELMLKYRLTLMAHGPFVSTA